MARRALPASLLLLAACSNTCGSKPSPRADLPHPSASASAAPKAAPAAPSSRVLLDMVEALPRCDVDHRGLLFDVGTEAMVGRYGWTSGAGPGVTPVEHDGSSWGRFTDRKLQLSFTLLDPTQIFVSVRAVNYAAKSLAISLDEQPLGTLRLPKGSIATSDTRATTLPVDPGLHTLTLRFYGRLRDGEAFADVDWIRVGVPDEVSTIYGPPTQRDAIAPAAALGGVPHRSLALRAPGVVRCAMRFPRAGRVRAAIGLQGAGEGDAEIRVVRDGKKPEVIRKVHLEGGDKARWTNVDLPLAAFEGRVGAVELRAVSAPRGGRVLFGDPAIVLPPVAAPPSPPVRSVIVVVLDGVARAELPPWSRATGHALPALAELASTGVVFDQHRAPATVVSTSVASLLTGLAPAAHGLTDSGARLPPGMVTIARIARDASVRTAMFTGVPWTFHAFGFGEGWEKYLEHTPSSGAAATAPIDDALAWLTDLGKTAPDARTLTIVHARGGHPPWDVTLKELSTAAPADYTGLIEPRSAAQRIARMRRAKRARVITEADRQRIRALAQIGLAGQDRALAALIAALKASGSWESTVLLVTGDVSSGVEDLFTDELDLREPALTLPLYAHFPGNLGAGRRVGEPTEMMDIAMTALAALGLQAPKRAMGKDLARIAADLDVATFGPQIATLDDRYAARWGDLVLSGRYPKPPTLCDLALDATCAFNRRDAMPIAAAAIFRRVVAADLANRAGAAKREPATIDQETSAAMNVWGATY
jgi:hypothetical protein